MRIEKEKTQSGARPQSTGVAAFVRHAGGGYHAQSLRIKRPKMERFFQHSSLTPILGVDALLLNFFFFCARVQPKLRDSTERYSSTEREDSAAAYKVTVPNIVVLIVHYFYTCLL